MFCGATPKTQAVVSLRFTLLSARTPSKAHEWTGCAPYIDRILNETGFSNGGDVASALIGVGLGGFPRLRGAPLACTGWMLRMPIATNHQTTKPPNHPTTQPAGTEIREMGPGSRVSRFEPAWGAPMTWTIGALNFDILRFFV